MSDRYRININVRAQDVAAVVAVHIWNGTGPDGGDLFKSFTGTCACGADPDEGPFNAEAEDVLGPVDGDLSQLAEAGVMFYGTYRSNDFRGDYRVCGVRGAYHQWPTPEDVGGYVVFVDDDGVIDEKAVAGLRAFVAAFQEAQAIVGVEDEEDEEDDDTAPGGSGQPVTDESD